MKSYSYLYMACIHNIKSVHLVVYGNGNDVESQRLNVTSNETIILHCNFDGIEPGMIQWMRNGNPVDVTVSYN